MRGRACKKRMNGARGTIQIGKEVSFIFFLKKETCGVSNRSAGKT